jgi:hypothetical protein
MISFPHVAQYWSLLLGCRPKNLIAHTPTLVNTTPWVLWTKNSWTRKTSPFEPALMIDSRMTSALIKLVKYQSWSWWLRVKNAQLSLFGC